jgi:hypothetical protein
MYREFMGFSKCYLWWHQMFILFSGLWASGGLLPPPITLVINGLSSLVPSPLGWTKLLSGMSQKVTIWD